MFINFVIELQKLTTNIYHLNQFIKCDGNCYVYGILSISKMSVLVMM